MSRFPFQLPTQLDIIDCPTTLLLDRTWSNERDAVPSDPDQSLPWRVGTGAVNVTSRGNNREKRIYARARSFITVPTKPTRKSDLGRKPCCLWITLSHLQGNLNCPLPKVPHPKGTLRCLPYALSLLYAQSSNLVCPPEVSTVLL